MVDHRIKIEELTASDAAALQRELALGDRICRFYIDDPSPRNLSELDRVLDLWLRDPREKKPSGNEVALGLGSLVGEQLRVMFGCRWVIVTNGSGCDLGMTHQGTAWQFFPRHWVAKRLDPVNAGQNVLSAIVERLRAEGMFVL